MSSQFWTMVGWVVGAGLLGLAITGLFVSGMKLSRNKFLIPYVLFVSIFLFAFITLNQIDLAALLAKNLLWGIIAGLLTSIILIRHVRSQPRSRKPDDPSLAFELGWAGLIYGFIDAALLNVMPVIAMSVALREYAWTSTIIGKIGVGVIELAASLLVALLYHLGYPEFRTKKVRFVFLGNSVITLAYILSGNPLGSLLSHPIMHIAAVLQGPETTVQLPPHYEAGSNPV